MERRMSKSGRLDSFVKSIVFPRPQPSTYSTTSRPHRLLHIPLVDPATNEENGSFTYGYLLCHPNATHLLLYAHPNAVDIGMLYDELQQVAKQASVDVLLFEYSGYGLTTSEITEASVHVDMRSAYFFVRRYLRVPAARTIICGRSIGSAPAASLCASLPPSETPSLLLLQCPFSALSDCINEFSHNAVSIANFLGYNWFRTIDVIDRVRCPVVLHHGTHDETVPISHSYALKNKRDTAAPPCVTYVYTEEGKRHNNLSRSVLVRILQEKVDSEGVDPLRVEWPGRLVAHPPIEPILFSSPDEELPVLDQVLALWKRSMNLRQLLQSRNSLYVLLTASTAVFAMRCAHLWQVYCGLERENTCNGQPYARCSKTEFVARCIACWGSPLGIHLPLTGLQPGGQAVVFGSYVPVECMDSFDTPVDVPVHSDAARLTVAELHPTVGLMKAVHAVLSTAPNLPLDEPIPCFIPSHVLSQLQTECERMIGCMPDDQWRGLQQLLRGFKSHLPSWLSAKASSLLASGASLDFARSEESFEELQEWLRPWTTPNLAMAPLAAEVPWDYYLCKGRVLARRHQLHRAMEWDECKLALKESGVVATIHALFEAHASWGGNTVPKA